MHQAVVFGQIRPPYNSVRCHFGVIWLFSASLPACIHLKRVPRRNKHDGALLVSYMSQSLAELVALRLSPPCACEYAS